MKYYTIQFPTPTFPEQTFGKTACEEFEKEAKKKCRNRAANAKKT